MTLRQRVVGLISSLFLGLAMSCEMWLVLAGLRQGRLDSAFGPATTLAWFLLTFALVSRVNARQPKTLAETDRTTWALLVALVALLCVMSGQLVLAILRR